MHLGQQPLCAVKGKSEVRNSSQVLCIHVAAVGTHPPLVSCTILDHYLKLMIIFTQNHCHLTPLQKNTFQVFSSYKTLL